MSERTYINDNTKNVWVYSLHQTARLFDVYLDADGEVTISIEGDDETSDNVYLAIEDLEEIVAKLKKWKGAQDDK